MWFQEETAQFVSGESLKPSIWGWKENTRRRMRKMWKEPNISDAKEDCQKGFRAKTIQYSTMTVAIKFLEAKTAWQIEGNIGGDAAYHRQNLRLVRRDVFHWGGCS